MGSRTPLFVLFGVVSAFVVALTLFGSSGTETAAESTVTTFADLDIPDPVATTTTSPRTMSVVPEIKVVSDLGNAVIPGLERLVVIEGQSPSGHTLHVVDHPSGETVVASLGPIVRDTSIDAGGEVLSYLADTGEDGWMLLPIQGPAVPIVVGQGIESFVWSGDEPNTAAWIDGTSQGEPQVVLGTFDGTTLRATETLDAAAARLVGLTEAGVWADARDERFPRNGFVELTSRADGTVSRALADLFVPPASGTRGLVGVLDITSWRWTFALEEDGIQPLPWAPGDASMAAFSPNGVQLAFAGTGSPMPGWVEIHSTLGGPGRRLELPYRVWDVRWSQRGDFVVLPGTDDRGGHVVVLVDARLTSAQEPWVYAVEFDDWVQFAAVVDGARGPGEPG